jgi:hypothetical protein
MGTTEATLPTDEQLSDFILGLGQAIGPGDDVPGSLRTGHSMDWYGPFGFAQRNWHYAEWSNYPEGVVASDFPAVETWKDASDSYLIGPKAKTGTGTTAFLEWAAWFLKDAERAIEQHIAGNYDHGIGPYNTHYPFNRALYPTIATTRYSDPSTQLASLASSRNGTNVGAFIYAAHYVYEYTIGGTLYRDYGPVVFSDSMEIAKPWVTPRKVYFPKLGKNFENYDVAKIKIYIFRTVDGGSVLYKIAEADALATDDFITDSTNDSALIAGELLYTSGGILERDPPPFARHIKIINNTAWFGHLFEQGDYVPVTVDTGTDIFTKAGHGMGDGDTLRFGVYGDTVVMPNPLIQGDVYYVVNKTADTFQVSTVKGGAAVNVTSAPTGTLYYQKFVHFEYTGRHSIQEDPDSCPATFRFDLNSSIVGIGAHRDFPLYICKRDVYRIEGSVDESGRGNVIPVNISVNSIGGADYPAPVETTEGVFFAGTDCFYFTDGYRMKKLHNNLKETYRALVGYPGSANFGCVTGHFIPEKNQIHWKLFPGRGYTHIVLHLQFGLGQEATFTTMNIRSDDDAYVNCEYEHQLVLSKHGKLFITDNAKVADADDASDDRLPIQYNFKTGVFSLGSKTVKKWVASFKYIFKNNGNQSVAFTGHNDNGRSSGASSDLRYRGAPGGLIEGKRHFAAGTLRCVYKQLEIENALTTNYASSEVAYGPVYCLIANQYTLGGVGTFPADVIGQRIYFGPNYTHGFKILSIGAQDLTIDPADSLPALGTPPGVAPATPLAFEIRGYPKDERLEIYTLELNFAPYGGTLEVDRGGEDDGGN